MVGGWLTCPINTTLYSESAGIGETALYVIVNPSIDCSGNQSKNDNFVINQELYSIIATYPRLVIAVPYVIIEVNCMVVNLPAKHIQTNHKLVYYWLVLLSWNGLASSTLFMPWQYLLMWLIALEIQICAFSDSVVKLCYSTFYAGFTCDVHKEVSDRHTRLIHRKNFLLLFPNFCWWAK